MAGYYFLPHTLPVKCQKVNFTLSQIKERTYNVLISELLSMWKLLHLDRLAVPHFQSLC